MEVIPTWMAAGEAAQSTSRPNKRLPREEVISREEKRYLREDVGQ